MRSKSRAAGCQWLKGFNVLQPLHHPRRLTYQLRLSVHHPLLQKSHQDSRQKKKKKKATPAASIPLSQKIKEFPETWVDLIPTPLWQQLRELRDTGNITSLTNVRVHISYEEQNKTLYFIPTSGTQALLSLPFLQQLFKPINITEPLHCAKF